MTDLLFLLEAKYCIKGISCALFIDDDISEAMRWHLPSQSKAISSPVFRFNAQLTSSSSLLTLKVERIVVVCSSDLRLTAKLIRQIIGIVECSECVVLTTASNDLCSQLYSVEDVQESSEAYSFLRNELESSVNLAVSYFPLHTIPIVPAEFTSTQQVEMHVLLSCECQALQPITLSRLAQLQDTPELLREKQSVIEVDASELPQMVKSELKTLAHQLAGAVVFDLGLDPTGSVYALGNTSSLLGHNIESIFAALTPLRAACTRGGESNNHSVNEDDESSRAHGGDPSGIQLRKDLQIRQSHSLRFYSDSKISSAEHNTDNHHDDNNLPPLSTASLLLVDRCEDLYSPSAHSGNCPLAHRILSTLKYHQYHQQVPIDAHSPHNISTDINISNKLCTATQCDVSVIPDSLHSPGRLCTLEENHNEANSNNVNQRGGYNNPSTHVNINASAHTMKNKYHGFPSLKSLSKLHTENVQQCPLSRPMSGLSGLPIQLQPSLCYRPLLNPSRHSSSMSPSISDIVVPTPSQLWQRVLCGPDEESGRQSIVAALQAAEQCWGCLPPPPPKKKRGLGAEVLAHVQALIATQPLTSADALSSTVKSSSLLQLSNEVGFNVECYKKELPLLSLSLAVVEAMQRSSSKQFQQFQQSTPEASIVSNPSTCMKQEWMCSFDTRASRELALEEILRKNGADIDVAFAHLMNYFLSPDPPLVSSSDVKHEGKSKSISPKGSSNNLLKKEKAGSKSSTSPIAANATSARRVDGNANTTEGSVAGPVDVTFMLLQVVRLLSLFRHRSIETSNFESLFAAIVDFILFKSPFAELHYLRGLGFLSQTGLQYIMNARKQAASTSLGSTISGSSVVNTISSSTTPTTSAIPISSVASLARGELVRGVGQRLSELQRLYASSRYFGKEEDLCNINAAANPATNAGSESTGGSLFPRPSMSSNDESGRDNNNPDQKLNDVDLLSSLVDTNSPTVLTDPATHDTTVNMISKSSSGLQLGLIARLINEFIRYRQNLSKHSNVDPYNNKQNEQKISQNIYAQLRFPAAEILELIESPLQRMKRAGLGLITKGLGSFGFGFGSLASSLVSATVPAKPHPAEQQTSLVVFVLGGLSYYEVGQVQRVLDAYAAEAHDARAAFSNHSSASSQRYFHRIILISTSTINPENICHYALSPNL